MKPLPLALAVSAAVFATGVQAAYNDAGTDYSNAAVDSHINDESFQPLQMVNMFLCIIKATGAETLWDQDYRALVDNDKCEQEAGMSGGESRDSDDRSTSRAIDYADVVVNSSRADNDSPQVVNAQYSITDTERYLVRTAVSSEPGANTPFGELRFTWQSANSQDDKGDLQIAADNGATVIKMIDQFDDAGDPISTRMRVQIEDAQGTAGSGVIEGWDWDTRSTITYQLAYNSQYLLKSDGSNDICLARPDIVEPTKKVWGYSLFRDDTGALLDIEAGFGFSYVDGTSGETRHGFIGNWGMWTEHKDTPTTITHKQTGQAYTVSTAPGKLIRQRKGVRSLVDGETFDLMSGGGWTQVTWNGTASRFEDNGSDAAVQPGTFLWSSSLNQEVNYQGDHDLNIGTPHAVAYSIQEVVQPGDSLFNSGAVPLTCYGNCPKPNVSKTDALAWNLYDGNFQDPATQTGTDYTLDPTDMTLRVGGEPVALAFTRDDLLVGEQFWGASVGEFVLQGTTVNGWQDLNGQGSVTYRWEYGLDSWNKLTLVKDSLGSYFEFDKPISLAYSHDGQTYTLEYQGARNLHGIPWSQNGTEWGPEFNIPSGTALDYVDSQGNTTTYRVKAVGIEKRMAAVDVSNCADLSLPDPTGITLPSFLDSDVADALNSVEGESFFTGLDVSGQAPRVIHGVVQE